jgi:hypothetical protein
MELRHRSTFTLLLASLGLLLSAWGGSAAPAASPAAHAGRPKLLVIVSVDGLGWPRLEQYRPWYVAGLKRLLDEGLVETECRYRHLNTETGPGHASLATGAPPRVHGIVLNRWLETSADGKQRFVYCTAQSAMGTPGTPPMFYREVAKDGRIYAFAVRDRLESWQVTGDVGAASVRIGYGPQGETVVLDSEDALYLYNFRHGLPVEPFLEGTVPGPGSLRTDTLGDRLVTSLPGARVVSLSGKDRAAIFLAGHNRGDVVHWFDQDNGRFVSSAAYDSAGGAAARGRSIVDTFNKKQAGSQLPHRFGTLWHKLPLPDRGAALLPTPVPADVLADFQIPVNGLFFDHDLRVNRNGYFSGIYSSPFIDELVADLAITFIKDPGFALGRLAQPDLLAVSFSAQDLVAHNYGPESEENLDLLRRLDVQLGRLLAALDAAVGVENYVLAFSADHGFSSIPEYEKLRDPAFHGGRIVDGPRVAVGFLDRVDRLLAQRLCLAPGSRPLAAIEGWNLYYTRPLALRTVEGACGEAGRLIGRAELDAALPKAVVTLYAEEIEDVYLTSGRDGWPDNNVSEFVRNDFDAERSGDAMLIPRPGVLSHWDPGRGSGHGSLYEPDIHVPLIFLGGTVTAGRSSTSCTPYDLAPTLAARAGLALPSATGHDLAPSPVRQPGKAAASKGGGAVH